MNVRDGRDIEGGLLVIRLFLALVFGTAAVTGLAIIVEHSSLLWTAFVVVMILPLLRASWLFVAAAGQSLRFLVHCYRNRYPDRLGAA